MNAALTRRRVVQLAAALPLLTTTAEAATMQVRRGARLADACQFDGSGTSAAEISRAFGATVAHHGSHVEVAGTFGRAFLPIGSWVVRDSGTGQIRMLDDASFARAFEPGPAGPVIRTEVERWDVV